jgi:hypothetical protein
MATAPKGKYAWRLRAFDTLADGRRIQNVIKNSDQYGKCQANNTDCSSNDQINAWFYAQTDCRARSAAIIQAMSEVPNNRGKAFVKQTTDWANHIVRKGGVEPKILYMLDDNNQGEHGVDGLGNGADGDADYVVKALRTEFGAGNVTLMDEPAGGVSAATLRNFDIVWFANPGHELDDMTTRDSLRSVRNNDGISVIVQGDDMAGGNGSGPDMTSLTNLNLVSNGTTTCGQTTDNNNGVSYNMQFTNESITALNGIIRDLRLRTYRYGEDVDHSTPKSQGEQILLEARRPANAHCPNGFQTPAAVALDPINLP